MILALVMVLAMYGRLFSLIHGCHSHWVGQWCVQQAFPLLSEMPGSPTECVCTGVIVKRAEGGETGEGECDPAMLTQFHTDIGDSNLRIAEHIQTMIHYCPLQNVTTPLSKALGRAKLERANFLMLSGDRGDRCKTPTIDCNDGSKTPGTCGGADWGDADGKKCGTKGDGYKGGDMTAVGDDASTCCVHETCCLKPGDAGRKLASANTTKTAVKKKSIYGKEHGHFELQAFQNLPNIGAFRVSQMPVKLPMSLLAEGQGKFLLYVDLKSARLTNVPATFLAGSKLIEFTATQNPDLASLPEKLF